MLIKLLVPDISSPSSKKFLYQITPKYRKEPDSKQQQDENIKESKDQSETLFENSPYKKREKRTTLPNLNSISSKLNKKIEISSAISKYQIADTSKEKSPINRKKLEGSFAVDKKRIDKKRNSLLPTSKLNLNPIILKTYDDSPMTHQKNSSLVKNVSQLNLTIDTPRDSEYTLTIMTSSKSQPGISRGKQKNNQDSYICKTNGLHIEDFNLFGVMDGHGSHGHFISQSVKSLFSEFLFDSTQYDSTPTLDSIQTKFQENKYFHIKQCFMYCETSLARSKYEVNFSGTTAVLVIQVGQTLYCANTGDSRAILYNDDGSIVTLSNDHKPDSPNERERIISSGGRVERFKDNGKSVGPYRVWLKYDDYPGLAMSRSLGDFVSKSVGCSCTPEIIEHKLTSQSKFLIIASDGVWEFLNNRSVCKFIEPFYECRDPEGASACIIEESTKMWEREDEGQDDITCVIVFYYASHKPKY